MIGIGTNHGSARLGGAIVDVFRYSIHGSHMKRSGRGMIGLRNLIYSTDAYETQDTGRLDGDEH